MLAGQLLRFNMAKRPNGNQFDEISNTLDVYLRFVDLSGLIWQVRFQQH